MIYEGQICRSPMERSAFMLPVMVGCSYNRCKFCNLFRHLKYRELPMEQIENELKRVKELNGNPRKIFLGDGNAFGLKAEHILNILERIHAYFPECRCINMDATVTSILKKSEDELQMLHANGVQHLYLGIESGLNDVLEFMTKGNNLTQAEEAIRRLQEHGMIYDAHIMTGVAGKGRGVENAEALADFLNRTHPGNVVNFSMFLHKEVPLYQDILAGSFTPANELENLIEERRLLELLGDSEKGKSCKMNYEGFHDYIQFRVRGILPDDRAKMLAKLDQKILEYGEHTEEYSYVQGECPCLERCEGQKEVWSILDPID